MRGKCGSGKAGVVAKRMGRSFIGIKIDEEYSNTAKRRICKNDVA
ncbi:MAG: site-specific DNA-methyltransferase [Planctomycetaceae bacterium]|jgi:DNA modification methylase|nr:site-specific DNA-methyltransferase [Planctomycetaceae bacterium]